MPYAAQSQLVERFGERALVELTDRAEPPAGAIDAAVLDRAIAEVDALIDGYLAARYDLPLAATPPLVAALAADLVFHRLHAVIVPEAVAEAARAARKLLEQIADGRVRLDLAGAEPAAAPGGVRATASPRVFTAGLLDESTR